MENQKKYLDKNQHPLQEGFYSGGDWTGIVYVYNDGDDWVLTDTKDEGILISKNSAKDLSYMTNETAKDEITTLRRKLRFLNSKLEKLASSG